MTKNVVETSSTAVHGPPGSQPGAEDSRTLLKRCLLDTVAPAFTLLCMAALTVTMIVVVVTTVAHAGWLTPPTYVSVDPWSSLYSDAEAPAGVSPEALADAGTFAAQTPE
ncbi:MAG: hypothetical protein ABFD90_04740 [Phycisphaerales bacterium]